MNPVSIRKMTHAQKTALATYMSSIDFLTKRQARLFQAGLALLIFASAPARRENAISYSRA